MAKIYVAHQTMVADINLVTPRTIAKGLTAPRDTNVVTVETQVLARGSI
jgi:hypothetical protein